MVHTLENPFGIAPQKAAYLSDELRKHFGDAWVTGYAPSGSSPRRRCRSQDLGIRMGDWAIEDQY